MQLLALINRLGLTNLPLPILLPGGLPTMGQLAPSLTDTDEKAVENVVQLANFLTGGSAENLSLTALSPSVAQEVSSGFQITQQVPSGVWIIVWVGYDLGWGGGGVGCQFDASCIVTCF